MEINIVTRVDISMTVENLLLIKESLFARICKIDNETDELLKLEILHNDICAVTDNIKC